MTRIGVLPACERSRRTRLFDALAAATGIEFTAGAEGADAVVSFDAPVPQGLPVVRFEQTAASRPGRVALEQLPFLAGRSLDEEEAPATALGPLRGDVVLATAGGRPVLTRHGPAFRAIAAPLELTGQESLRDRFVEGRFLGLLPVLELIRTSGLARWSPPAPLACFVLDDPNLHRPRYGHVDFAALAAHAGRHGYHVAVATVPADQWWVSRRAAEIFRSSSSLSLALHGNGHVEQELGRALPPDAREALVAQALRRAERAERRHALPIARVMVAPHESCTPEMGATLARSEIEALCIGWGVRAADRPLADWLPLDLRPGGLAVVPRRPLAAGRGELALRAYLGQPLVLGLHHGDLAGGLDVLAEAATELDALAHPRWAALGDIARAAVETGRDGGTLRVRAYARRFALALPEWADRVEVELPPTHDSPGDEAVTVAIAAGRVSGSLRRRDAFDHRLLPHRRPQPWVYPRRALVEARDRLQGALAR